MWIAAKKEEMASKRKVEQDTEQDESIAVKIPKSDVRSGESTSKESCSKTCDNDKKNVLYMKEKQVNLREKLFRIKLSVQG